MSSGGVPAATAALAPAAGARRIGGYDAVVLVSFGGPEGPDEVMPFLENVTRGRAVPPARLAQVADRYRAVGGRSPINDHNRALLAALRTELDDHRIDLPLYWGNRNWHPLLADTVTTMVADGVERALAFVTSAFSSYSGCRQYLEDIEAATAAPGSPHVDKLRVFGNHPGFVTATADRLRGALAHTPDPATTPTRLVFTAHSVPTAMAATSDYELQLRDCASEVAGLGGFEEWDLVFQSRSGPPSVPWLEPDVNDHLGSLAAGEIESVVAVPLGFVSDHMEVVHDLDTEAAATAATLGLAWTRVPTVGTHPRFVAMVRELIGERLDPTAPRLAVGRLGPRADPCVPGCCPRPPRGGRPPA